MDVAVPDSSRNGGLLAWVAASVEAPAASVGDPGQFLDIDVDQLAWQVTLIPARFHLVGGSVSPIETTDTGPVQDVLHR